MSESLIILGAGESGIGAAILGKKEGFDVLVSEYGSIHEETKSFFEKEGIAFEESGHSHLVMEGDLVVKSPGIPDNAPVILRLLAKGVPVISEIEFAFRYLKEDQKVVAITGTNGKTTTTLLIHHLLKTAGFDVGLGGNIGISLAKLVAQTNHEYLVVEVSSFQLDGVVTFKPNIAVLLNITPDHLDRYDHDFKKYVKSKFKITENLTKDECLIYCSDCKPITDEIARRKVESCLFAVSATQGGKSDAYMAEEHLIFDYKFKNRGKHHKIPLTQISLIGKHNMINTMAAVLATLNLDVPLDKILKGLKTFKNVPHRLELVHEVDGVRFINDSKATNVDAVYYALEGLQKPIIWIAGGIDKGNDYHSITHLVREKVKHLICIGTDNKSLLKAFENVVPITEISSMEIAVGLASEMSEPGELVLLSPACSSFDRFKNYEDRGDQFKKAVEQLQKNRGIKL